MSYKGIVFFDYDGTLVDESKQIFQITDKTKQAIERLQANGYLAVLCTGRSKCYVPEIPIAFDALIANNGGYVEFEGECIHKVSFELPLLKEMLEYLDSHEMEYAAEESEQCFCNRMKDCSMEDITTQFKFDMSCFRLKTIDEILKSKEGIHKLLVTFRDRNGYKKYEELFHEQCAIVPHRVAMYGDVVPLGVSKALGIEALLKHLQISVKDSYAFGDSLNDFEMLEFVGHGIAMGNHAIELEKVANYITESVANEGIYYGLDHFGLI